MRYLTLTSVNATSYTQISCRLPAGTGVQQEIIVFRGAVASYPQAIVSYALPVISSLEGCTMVDGKVKVCNRTGSDLLTVRGTNFGESGAQVFVGGRPCVVPTGLPQLAHQNRLLAA